MAEAFPIGGNIDPKTFPFLLADIHRQGATGSLKVEGPAYPKALYFRGGRILFGSSNDPKDQLGAILIESGKISPEQLDEVNTKVGPGNPLAKVLAESGFVNQRELSESARVKVERILSDVLSYTTGSFEFEDGVLPKGAVDLKLSTEKLVLAAVLRLADRAFVLRHLESLAVVLAPLPETSEKLEELRSDSGELPERLDGHRSLKDAAALTRLDEFEAAKVACALLFLGLVKKGDAAGSAPASGDEVDLAQTARMAFDDPPPAEAPVAAAAEPEPAFYVPEGAEIPVIPPAPELVEAPSESVEPFDMTMPDTPVPHFGQSETPPLGTAMARSSAVLYPPVGAEPEPEPTMGFNLAEVNAASGGLEIGSSSLSEPEDVTMPRVPQLEKKTEALPRAAPPPLAAPPPPPAPAAIRPALAFEEEAPHEVVPPTRPSKEDLAALDALLNPSAPQRSASMPAQRPRAERWEPHFRSGPVPASAHPNRKPRASTLPIVAGLLVLIVAGGAAWYILQRPPRTATTAANARPSPPTTQAAAPPTTQSAPQATTLAPAPPPESLATPPPTVAPAPPPPATIPPATTPPKPAAAGSIADARRLLEQRNYSGAARGFAKSIRTAADARWSVQLLVACSDETVDKALNNVRGHELLILPVSYKGKSCYRLCWGVYESEAKADAALSTVPAYFREGGAKPKAAATASLLP